MTDMKYDSGKILASIPIDDFGRALEAVSEVGTFGAKKYARSSWKTVQNGSVRYRDALFRHAYKQSYEDYDEESGLLHAAHLAWNALAVLQLKLEEEQYPERPMTGIFPTLTEEQFSKVFKDSKNTAEQQPELDF